jgi:hypothetical protein
MPARSCIGTATAEPFLASLLRTPLRPFAHLTRPTEIRSVELAAHTRLIEPMRRAERADLTGRTKHPAVAG